MLEHHIADWDNAYANGANIAGSDRWPAAWVEPAQAFRDALSAEGRARLDIAYGDGRRNRLDLFLPGATPKGLVVFIHGGYWKAFDKSFWSHLANGAIGHGYAVAMPSYTLCPEIRIAGIVREIGAAIGKAAEMVDGPLMLTGHSAGGHLASRMVTATTPLAAECGQAHTPCRVDLRCARPAPDHAHRHERDTGNRRGRSAGRKPGAAAPDGRCPHHLLGRRRRARRVPAPERACLPTSGPAWVPRPTRWSSPTGIISASSTALPIRRIR